MISPFSPAEAKAAQVSNLPDDVINVVNTLLSKRASGRTIVIKQEEVVDQLKKAGYTSEQIQEAHLLDFEAAFTQAGWKVIYDRPAYNESGYACWRFTVKR